MGARTPAAWHDGSMALSKKLLSRDEVVVRHMHTHIKVLLWRFVVEILLLVVGVVASVMAPTTWQPWGIVAIWVVILVVSVPLLLLPWLQWYMHTYTITTKRIITRSGIINRVGHDLPLTRISDIQLDKDVTDRFFGCGTLALQTSADDPLLLHDVPPRGDGPGRDLQPDLQRHPGRHRRRPPAAEQAPRRRYEASIQGADTA